MTEMDKGAAEHMHGTTQSARELADRVKCLHVDEVRAYARPRGIHRNNSAESYGEVTKDNSCYEVA